MIVATAGHVDHGKTALVKHLTGVDTDRLEEEKRRGLSINLGYAYRELANGSVMGFIDVPGHSRFINTMIAGVGGIDLGLLVVAADDGLMPQTLEHLDILRLLGVHRLLLVISKIDRVDSDRLLEVKTAAQALLPAETPVYEISNTTGAGIEDLRAALDQLGTDWQPRQANGEFRLSIDRAFTLQGIGLVATGTVIAGEVHVGDHLQLQPQAERVRVRGLHVQDRKAERARAGDRCALNIAGSISREEIVRGDWLLSETGMPPVQRFDARVQMLSDAAFSLKNLSPVRVHIGARRIPAKIYLVEAEGSRLKPGQQGLAQLMFDTPVIACRGDRFLLRDDSESLTLGGGHVLDPFAPRSGKRREERLLRLNALEQDTPAEALKTLLFEAGLAVDAEQFRQSCNLQAQEFKKLLEPWQGEFSEMPGERRLLVAGDGPVVDVQARTEETPVEPMPRPWPLVEQLLEKAGRRIPSLGELADAAGGRREPVELLLNWGIRSGRVHKLNDNRYALSATLLEFAQLAQELAADADFTVIQYRDHCQCGRNLAIQVLEYFDAVGFTYRRGDVRTVRADRVPEDLFSG